jgi:flagella basal body P-ring formation protein FlgA
MRRLPLSLLLVLAGSPVAAICAAASTPATLVAMAPPVAQAPQAPSARQLALQVVQDAASRAEPALRAELEAGEIDPQLRFAPCDSLQAQLRPGTPMRGRVIVTMRCDHAASGAAGWTATLPVTVRLYGPALVSSRSIAALETVPETGLRTEEVEWTREPMGLATRPGDLTDRISTMNIPAGQPLPLRALRARPAFGQGDTVKLVGLGGGFQISTEAVALAQAAPGEAVRVRTESGRTIAGIARHGRVVEVEF